MASDAQGVRIIPMVEMRSIEAFHAWPVAHLDAFRTIAISGRLTPAEIGAVIATLTYVHLRAKDGLDLAEADAGTVIRGLLDRDGLILPGGLEVRDLNADTAVVPGCCCGLESWREWSQVLDGKGLWLGHDPTPWIELDGDGIRVWQDSRAEDGASVDLPTAALPVLLRSVHQDLQGFLHAVGEWAGSTVPSLAADLMLMLDQAFDISKPLKIYGESRS